MLEKKFPQSVLLVEDHGIVRAALKAEIRKFSEAFEVIGEATDSASAIEKVKTINPQLIFLDHSLGSSTGLEFLNELKNLKLSSHVVVFTQSLNPHVLRSYWQSNVLGLLAKASEMEDLHKALQSISQGHRYLSDSLKKVIFSSPDKLLSKRELEVVSMVAKGLSNKEVAEALSCSDQTIKTHKSNIMKKLGIDNSVELGIWASENGVS